MSIVDEFIEEVESAIKKGLKFDKSKVLYEAAVEYLAIVESTRQEVEDLEYALSAAAQLRSTIREERKDPHTGRRIFMQYEEYRKLDKLRTEILKGEAVETLYRETFKFQQILNYSLGQNSVMVYVQNNKGTPEIIEFKEMDFISFGASSSNQLTGRFNLSKRQLKKLQDQVHVLDLEKELGVDPERLLRLQATYAEVMERLSRAREHKSDMILWLSGGEWYGMRVSGGEGDINEAYVSFAIMEDQDPAFDGDMEENVETYMMDPVHGVGAVDNASGLLQGDVSRDGIEYAVKSAGASALGLLQIETLARKIVSKAGQFTIEELQAEKQALADVAVCRDIAIKKGKEERLKGAKEVAASAPKELRAAIIQRIDNMPF